MFEAFVVVVDAFSPWTSGEEKTRRAVTRLVNICIMTIDDKINESNHQQRAA